MTERSCCPVLIAWRNEVAAAAPHRKLGAHQTLSDRGQRAAPPLPTYLSYQLLLPPAVLPRRPGGPRVTLPKHGMATGHAVMCICSRSSPLHSAGEKREPLNGPAAGAPSHLGRGRGRGRGPLLLVHAWSWTVGLSMTPCICICLQRG